MASCGRGDELKPGSYSPGGLLDRTPVAGARLWVGCSIRVAMESNGHPPTGPNGYRAPGRADDHDDRQREVKWGGVPDGRARVSCRPSTFWRPQRTRWPRSRLTRMPRNSQTSVTTMLRRSAAMPCAKRWCRHERLERHGLSEFPWLVVTGTAGRDDLGLTPRGRLIVSETALEHFRQGNLGRCDIEEYDPNTHLLTCTELKGSKWATTPTPTPTLHQPRSRVG